MRNIYCVYAMRILDISTPSLRALVLKSLFLKS